LKQKSKTPQELFDVVKQSIQVFELDQNTFDKSIEYMIKMDYIKLEDQKYIKIFY
jgi:competence protein ComGC